MAFAPRDAAYSGVEDPYQRAGADSSKERFRSPGAIERIGQSYDVVKAINPRIIYAQVRASRPRASALDLC